MNPITLINKKIRDAEIQYHRGNHTVSLLAVTKHYSAEKIREFYNAGQIAFGENYLQDALEKKTALSDLAIEWHFIGHIQSNKTKLIAQHFDWVQSVDRFSIAEKLNHHRASMTTPLNVCIQVNIDAEETKSGISSVDLQKLATEIGALKHLKLRGLMIIPKIGASQASFEKAFLLQQGLIEQGFMLDTLSMGMSDDFEAAIAAGSTMVRIGRGLS